MRLPRGYDVMLSYLNGEFVMFFTHVLFRRVGHGETGRNKAKGMCGVLFGDLGGMVWAMGSDYLRALRY